jgi:hypothetical protein
MKYPNANIFAAWFLMLQTLAMGWVAAMGRLLLELLGVATTEGDIPGRLVGALLLLLIVFLIWYFMHGLPPQGKPEGNGFKAGHRVLLTGNILAGLLFVFHFFATSIDSYNTHLILNKFTTSFGYFSMGLFAVGFSLVYQSSLPQEKNS